MHVYRKRAAALANDSALLRGFCEAFIVICNKRDPDCVRCWYWTEYVRARLFVGRVARHTWAVGVGCCTCVYMYVDGAHVVLAVGVEAEGRGEGVPLQADVDSRRRLDAAGGCFHGMPVRSMLRPGTWARGVSQCRQARDGGGGGRGGARRRDRLESSAWL